MDGINMNMYICICIHLYTCTLYIYIECTLGKLHLQHVLSSFETVAVRMVSVTVVAFFLSKVHLCVVCCACDFVQNLLLAYFSTNSTIFLSLGAVYVIVSFFLIFI